MKPQIVVTDVGFHNANLDAVRARLTKAGTFKDLSTVCFIPSRGMIHMKVALSHENLIKPMNQKFTKIPLLGMEVGAAYEAMIDVIRSNPELQKWKYVLTMEDDNIPPQDGLMKLFEDIESGPWDAVGGLYFTKGEAGQPMCYGMPQVMPKTFIPWLPPDNSVTECNGLGMGFTLFRMKMFLNEKIPRPLFKTVQEFIPGVGTKMYTQDLRFFEEAAKYGHRFACSTRVKVGHFDATADDGNGFCW